MNNNASTAAILNVLADCIADAQRRLEQPAATEPNHEPRQKRKYNFQPITRQSKPLKFELFQHPEYGTIQTTVIDGKPYFRANSIAKAAGYVNGYSAVEHLPDRIKIIAPSPNEKDVNRPTIFIPESAVQCLINRRKVHELTKLGMWITNEVVPQITGKRENKPVPSATEPMLPPDGYIDCVSEDYGTVTVAVVNGVVYYKGNDVAKMVGLSGMNGYVTERLMLINKTETGGHSFFIPASSVRDMLERRRLLDAPVAKMFIHWLLDEIPERVQENKNVVSIA